MEENILEGLILPFSEKELWKLVEYLDAIEHRCELSEKEIIEFYEMAKKLWVYNFMHPWAQFIFKVAKKIYEMEILKKWKRNKHRRGYRFSRHR